MKGSHTRFLRFSILCLLLCVSCAPSRVSTRGFRTPDQAFTAGEIAFEQGRYNDAVEAYQSFLEAGTDDPRLPEVYLKLGRSFIALDDNSQALDFLERIVKGYPDSPQREKAALSIYRIAYLEGNVDGALSGLRSLVRDARDRETTAGAYLLRGMIFLKRNDLSLALSQWKKSLLVTGEHDGGLQLYKEMAKLLEEAATDQELEQMALDQSHGFPGDLALFVMGKNAWERGEPIRSSQIFEEFSSLFPAHPLLQEVEPFLEQGGHIQSLSRVRIGCILPLSGSLKEIGNQVLQGVSLSVERLNAIFLEEKVVLTVKDSGGDPQRARAALEELALEPDVVAVIGPVISRSMVECAMVAEDSRLPIITPTATAEGIGEMGEYIFRNAMTNEAQARAIARYAVEDLGLRTFIVFYPDDYYGTELNDSFAEELASLGGEIRDAIPYKRGTVDYGPQIRNAIQVDLEWILTQNADIIPLEEFTSAELMESYYPSFDAVYLPGYAEDVGLLIPQLAYYEISSVRLFGSHNWNSMELIRRGEHYVDGAVFTEGFYAASPHTDIAEFVAAYRKAYGEEPTLFSAQSYDAAEMILQVLYRGGRSREDIRNGLLDQQNFPGVSGLTRVLPSGEMDKDLFLIRVEDGSFQQMN